MHLKLLQKEWLKKTKKTEVTDRITKVSKASPKNNSETNEEEIIRERFIPSELSHKIINDLRLKEEIIDYLRLI